MALEDLAGYRLIPRWSRCTIAVEIGLSFAIKGFLIHMGGETMFDSLDEQMKHDLKEASSPKERILLWISVAVVSVLVFGGLYIGVRVLE